MKKKTRRKQNGMQKKNCEVFVFCDFTVSLFPLHPPSCSVQSVVFCLHSLTDQNDEWIYLHTLKKYSEMFMLQSFKNNNKNTL